MQEAKQATCIARSDQFNRDLALRDLSRLELGGNRGYGHGPSVEAAQIAPQPSLQNGSSWWIQSCYEPVIGAAK